MIVIAFRMISLLWTLAFFNRENLGVDDLAIKLFLGGYLDGGSVEELPWE